MRKKFHRNCKFATTINYTVTKLRDKFKLWCNRKLFDIDYSIPVHFVIVMNYITSCDNRTLC